MRRIFAHKAVATAAAALALCLVAGADAQAQRADRLGAYRIAPDGITVSGLSSGGYMAHQFHVAYSATVGGAAILAAGPYGCAQHTYWTMPWANALTVAGLVCTHKFRDAWPFLSWAAPDAPQAGKSIRITDQEARRAPQTIDDPSSLKGDKVWLFSGSNDETVPTPIVESLAEYYGHYGADVLFDRDGAAREAGHAMIVARSEDADRPLIGACSANDPPYVNECRGFDAAGRLLRHLYGDLSEEPGSADRSNLLAFDQTEFFEADDATIGLHRTGHIYVPDQCDPRDGGASECRLHVAFHGCRQSEDRVGDDFYWDAGYNRWAEANGIIVLYPQATGHPVANPEGCWDWWGYSGAEYFRKDGRQMRAVKAMIDRLSGQ